MNKKIFSYLFSYLLSTILFLPIVISAQASTTKACTLLKSVETALVAIGATLVIVGWIVAGILYLSSMGSTERMGTAKKAITAAIIGTILVILSASAYAVVNSFLGGGGPGSTC